MVAHDLENTAGCTVFRIDLPAAADNVDRAWYPRSGGTAGKPIGDQLKAS